MLEPLRTRVWKSVSVLSMLGKVNSDWTTDLTFSTNKEEVTKLATGLPQDLVNNWFVGYPVDTYYGYVAYPKVWGCSKEDMD